MEPRSCGGREGATLAVGGTGLASEAFGLGGGRPLGEGGGLAFGLAASLLELMACLVEFAPEASGGVRCPDGGVRFPGGPARGRRGSAATPEGWRRCALSEIPVIW